MKKLSEQFLEMSQRTAALEKHISAIQEENRKDFETHVAAGKAALRSAQTAFTARLDKIDESLAEPWRELDEAFAAQVTRVQQNVDEHLNALDLASAKANAEDAETYAEIAAEFARVTAAHAEEAMLEAKQARAAAQSLETVHS